MSSQEKRGPRRRSSASHRRSSSAAFRLTCVLAAAVSAAAFECAPLKLPCSLPTCVVTVSSLCRACAQFSRFVDTVVSRSVPSLRRPALRLPLQSGFSHAAASAAAALDHALLRHHAPHPRREMAGMADTKLLFLGDSITFVRGAPTRRRRRQLLFCCFVAIADCAWRHSRRLRPPALLQGCGLCDPDPQDRADYCANPDDGVSARIAPARAPSPAAEMCCSGAHAAAPVLPIRVRRADAPGPRMDVRAPPLRPRRDDGVPGLHGQDAPNPAPEPIGGFFSSGFPARAFPAVGLPARASNHSFWVGR